MADWGIGALGHWGALDQAARDGWKLLADSPVTVIGTLEPKPGEFTFTTMAPGWHITSRPAATLFEPTVSATGRYAVESEVFLFPGTSTEGFGLFVGGRDLEGPGRYVAFLIRRDGSAAVERRDGAKTTRLSPWTRHAAITPHPGGNETARNVLRIEAEAAQVAFLVNGTRVLE